MVPVFARRQGAGLISWLAANMIKQIIGAGHSTSGKLTTVPFRWCRRVLHLTPIGGGYHFEQTVVEKKNPRSSSQRQRTGSFHAVEKDIPRSFHDLISVMPTYIVRLLQKKLLSEKIKHIYNEKFLICSCSFGMDRSSATRVCRRHGECVCAVLVTCLLSGPPSLESIPIANARSISLHASTKTPKMC